MSPVRIRACSVLLALVLSGCRDSSGVEADAATGPAGPAGPPGRSGPAGAKGAIGAMGAMGAMGVMGALGAPGSASGGGAFDGSVPAPNGHIVMYPPEHYAAGATAPWLAFTPDGNPIAIPSTTTAGLQEVLSVLTATGYSLDAYGPGGVASNLGALFASTTINVPPLRNQYVRLHGIGAYGGSNGYTLVLDSMVEASFAVEGGQIGSNIPAGGNQSGAVSLAPSTPLPFEGFVAIASSIVQLGNISCNTESGTSAYSLFINTSAGGVVGATIEALEVNGAGGGDTSTTQVCVAVAGTPGSGSSFSSNYVHINDIHLCSSAGWQEGLSEADGAQMFGNTIDINSIEPSGAAATGFNTFGSHDIVRIGTIDNSQGNVQTCVVLEPNATNNQITVNCNAFGGTIATGVLLAPGAVGNVIILNTSGAVTTPIVDNSGGQNTVILNGAPIFSGLPIGCVSLPSGQVFNNGGNLGVCPQQAVDKHLCEERPVFLASVSRRAWRPMSSTPLNEVSSAQGVPALSAAGGLLDRVHPRRPRRYGVREAGGCRGRCGGGAASRTDCVWRVEPPK